MKNSRFLAAIVGTLIAGTVSAHTTSLGFTPGVNAGELVIWAGSYSHGGGAKNEGLYTLTGPNGYNVTQSPAIVPVSVKPSGLVDGVSNFFWHQAGSGYSFPNNTDTQLFGPVVVWQGSLFTGLVAGTYNFTCGTQCGTTAQWDSLSSGTVALTFSASQVAGGGNGTGGGAGSGTGGSVPVPASLALLAIGLVGFLGSRHKGMLKA
jgi:hypothetical protein